MALFSSLDIVRLWEEGARQHPLDRALTVLARALPGVDRESLARLTIGERDALLLELRERTFGDSMEAFVDCPRCGERLQFSLRPAALRLPPAGERGELRFAEEGYEVRFRLPDSRDLAAAAHCGSIERGRDILARRCVLEARCDGLTVPVAELPEGLIAGIGERMAETDPQSDILLNLDCPACSAGWRQPFDIVSFFWAEIVVHAQRLLREVHALARAYGWGEGEILSMSATRRSRYLEMIEG